MIKNFILIFFSNIRMGGVNIALEISKTRRGKKKKKKRIKIACDFVK